MVDRGYLSNFQKNLGFLDSRILTQVSLDPVELTVGFSPGECDVICSRGAESYRHTGNERLRNTIDTELEKYSNADTKFAKSIIVSDVVDGVRARSEGRGFIRQNKSTGEWHVLSDKLSREKVGQLFRTAISKKTHISCKGTIKRPANSKRVKEQHDIKSFMEMIATQVPGSASLVLQHHNNHNNLQRQVTPDEGTADPRSFLMHPEQQASARSSLFNMDLTRGPQISLDDYAASSLNSQLAAPEINRVDSLQNAGRLQAMDVFLAKHQPTAVPPVPQRIPHLSALQSTPSLTPPALLNLTSIGSFSFAHDRQTSTCVPTALEPFPSTGSLGSFGTTPAFNRITSFSAPVFDRIPSLSAPISERVPSFGYAPMVLDRVTFIDPVPPTLQGHLSLLL